MTILVFEAFIEWMTSLIAEYLYAGVFFAAIIETLIHPIPRMAVFPTS